MKVANGVWCLCAVLSLVTQTATTRTNSKTTSKPALSATCPVRSINYLTHSLRQQCLATTRTLANSTTGTSTTATAIATSGLSSGNLDDLSVSNNSETRPVSAQSQATDTSSTSNNDSIVHHGNSTTTRPPETYTATVETLPAVAVDVLHRPVDSEDDDSALGGGNFLSFEDWKRQNLKKAGQSEHVGQRAQIQHSDPRKRPQNSLESLGDDGEIDIDFSGFVPGGPDAPREPYMPPVGSTPSESGASDPAVQPPLRSRSREVGTTGKERFNFASFDCAANVRKTNKEAKSPNAILIENKDSYMLNKCAAQDKVIVLELCEDILMDTVVLANFEFFSSTFRQFRISVSDLYPVKPDKWKSLGVYEARNTRQIQAFPVQSTIWARYVRIEFLSHYGNEFYCPISLIRVHGTTMMDDYRHDLEPAAGSDDDDDNTQPAGQTLLSTDAAEIIEVSVETTNSVLVPAAQVAMDSHADEKPQVSNAVPLALPEEKTVPTISTETLEQAPPVSLVAIEAIMSVIEPSHKCLPLDVVSSTLSQERSTTHTSNTLPAPAYSATTPQTTAKSNISDTANVKSPITTSQASDSGAAHRASLNSTIETPQSDTLSAQLSYSSHSSIAESSARSETGSMAVDAAPRPKVSGTSTSQTASERSKTSSGTHAHQPLPSAQDSFFKSVQKRIQMLEANSTMSLQYIEDQSRALRDAFKKVEQRQLARTNTFLDLLNQTVLTELRDFRQQYDQLWQSTVIELELQREQYEKDNEAINTRISILADEVIFQRRLAILQMILILVCLMLVLFSRTGGLQSYLDLPIVANVLAKSPSSRWLNLSTDSLSRITPTRTRSAQQLRTERTGLVKSHQRIESEDSITDIQSSNEMYAPPTPVSDYQSEVDLSRDEEEKDVGQFDDPEFDPSMIERPLSSPPTLVLASNEAPLVNQEASISHERSVTFDEKSQIATREPSLADPRSLSNDSRHLTWNLPEDSHME